MDSESGVKMFLICKNLKKRKKLADLETYVFIDASNIRAACLKTCEFQIDFVGLIKYFQTKYPKLKEISYYEGLAKGDERKTEILKGLRGSGYSIKTLERKAYVKDAVKKSFICKKCGHRNIVTVLQRTKMLKSNVDVYLAAEMLENAFCAKKNRHIVIVSCDGDYVEAIKIAMKNPKIRITMMATPATKDFSKNTLSSRLKELNAEFSERYRLFNIEDIKDRISIKNEDDPESASSRVGNASPVP